MESGCPGFGWVVSKGVAYLVEDVVEENIGLFRSVIQLHTFMLTCLGSIFISCASSFSILLRVEWDFSDLLLGEGNVVSIRALGLILWWV